MQVRNLFEEDAGGKEEELEGNGWERLDWVRLQIGERK
jgi:hypothetical protein